MKMLKISIVVITTRNKLNIMSYRMNLYNLTIFYIFINYRLFYSEKKLNFQP